MNPAVHSFSSPAEGGMMPGLYYMDIRDMADCAEALERHLAPRPLERLRSFKKEKDRLRFLAGSLLMARFLDRKSLDALQRGPHGKPFLVHGPCFNLSHSGNLVVFALDAHPVGIDVEMWRCRDYEKLALACFHPGEIAQLKKADGFRRAFFDLWALKESYVKMLGCGVSKKLSSFCLRVQGDRAFLDGNPDSTPFFRLYSLFPQYSLALCAGHDHWPDTFRKIHPHDIFSEQVDTNL